METIISLFSSISLKCSPSYSAEEICLKIK